MLMVIEEIKLMHVNFDRPRFSARLICVSITKAMPSNLGVQEWFPRALRCHNFEMCNKARGELNL